MTTLPSVPDRAGPLDDFAGWGQATHILDLEVGDRPIANLDQPNKGTLRTRSATAICGKDITTSCLYYSALCAAEARELAPEVLHAVAADH
jgi:hypothetical protein